MYEDRRPRMTPPVKEGDELDVKIEAVGEKGDGIAKKDGFVLFVPGVKEGDQVKIRVTRVLRKVGFAELISKSAGGASEDATEQPKEESAESAEEPEEPSQDSENFGEE